MQEPYDIHESANNLIDVLFSKSIEVTLPETEVEKEKDYAINQELTLFDEEDKEILMHRDAHFSGNFDVMYSYYEDEKKGAVLDVALERIKELKILEERMQKNLAPLLLQGPDAEKVSLSKALYKKLSNQYDEKVTTSLEKALCEVIFSEDESNDERIKTICSFGDKAIPQLIALFENPLLHDPLFPGYGKAPQDFAKALGLLQAESAVPILFQQIGTSDFDLEEACLKALENIPSAKDFCLKILKSRPITKDTEKAALCLLSFKPGRDIQSAYLVSLEDPEVRKREHLCSLCILGCQALDQDLKSTFFTLIKNTDFPKSCIADIELIQKKLR